MTAEADMEQAIRVKVRLYATLRSYLPGVSLGESSLVQLPNGTTLGDLLDRLAIPAVEVKNRFVNGLQREIDHPLQDGDEVALFPPVGGG